jgi:hypothetical protein
MTMQAVPDHAIPSASTGVGVQCGHRVCQGAARVVCVCVIRERPATSLKTMQSF